MIPSCRPRTKRVAALNMNEKLLMVEKTEHLNSRATGAQHKFYIQIEEAEKLAFSVLVILPC